VFLQHLSEKHIAGEIPKANRAMSANTYIEFQVEFRKISLLFAKQFYIKALRTCS
jgi:hypothetical protein